MSVSLLASAFLSYGVLALAVPGSSKAVEAESEYARPGLYVGLRGMGASYAVAEDELEDALMGAVDIEIDDVSGFDVVLGWRATEHVAVEAQFDWLDTAKISAGGALSARPKIGSLSATINAKLYALPGRFQPYVLFGAGLMHTELTISTADERFTGPAVRFGGGAEIYLSEHIAVDLAVDYLLPSDDVEDLDYVSYGGGLVFRF